MTRKWSNLNLPGALHFITGNFSQRFNVFSQPQCCESFLKTYSDLGREWPSKLIAYVLMPDHFHMIVNPKDGRIKEFTGKLKGVAAHSIVSTAVGITFKTDSEGSHEVWQESFKAVPLWSAWMIWQKINYIHANPLKAGLVTSAKEYRWSSFRAFYGGEEVPIPVDKDWWWPDDSEKLSQAMKQLGWKTYHKRNE